MSRRRLAALLVLMSACAAPEARDRDSVVAEIAERVGAPGAEVVDGQGPLPRGCDLTRELSADDAAALALYRSPRFAADLARLDLAAADLEQAGLLTNPVLSLLLPVGPKQLEATLNVAFDALWKRPRRVALAAHEVEAVAADLVRDGSLLVRDVKIAVVDWQLAEAESRELLRRAELSGRRAELEERRVQLGESAPAEAGRLRAAAERAAALSEEANARERALRLRAWALIGPIETPVEPRFRGADSPAEAGAAAFVLDLEALATEAHRCRPDLAAARQRVDAALERSDLAAADILRISALLDANEKGTEGFEIGPGFQLELPVFDQGSGREARARAELERAWSERAALEWEVLQEIRERVQDLEAKRQSAARREQIALVLAPERVRALGVEREAGGASDVEVLEAEIEESSDRVEWFRARAERQRAIHRLEAAVGRRLVAKGS